MLHVDHSSPSLQVTNCP